MIGAVIGVALAASATQVATVYFRRSARSIEAASSVWDQMASHAGGLIDDHDLPNDAAVAAFAFTQVAGCGCFVRGILMQHYLPWVIRRSDRPSRFSQILESLSPDQRREMDALVMMVIVFDSFANPLQGWAMRRLLRSYARPVEKPVHDDDVREARNVAASVLQGKRLRASELVPA